MYVCMREEERKSRREKARESESEREGRRESEREGRRESEREGERERRCARRFALLQLQIQRERGTREKGIVTMVYTQ